MLDDYINNFEKIVSSIFFVGFKVIAIILIVLLILSLILIAIGCLIKSQKIKSKFLKVTPCLLLGNIFFLMLPYFILYVKNLL